MKIRIGSGPPARSACWDTAGFESVVAITSIEAV